MFLSRFLPISSQISQRWDDFLVERAAPKTINNRKHYQELIAQRSDHQNVAARSFLQMLCQCPVHSQKLLCNGLLVGQPSLNGLHTLPNMSSSLLLHLTNYFTLLRGSGVQIRYPHW